MKYSAYETGIRAYQARLSLSKKQSDVCDATGISQAAYSRFETGQGDIPISKAAKLCNYLGVSMSWLIGEETMPHLTDNERIELERYKNYLISRRNK